MSRRPDIIIWFYKLLSCLNLNSEFQILEKEVKLQSRYFCTHIYVSIYLSVSQCVIYFFLYD